MIITKNFTDLITLSSAECHTPNKKTFLLNLLKTRFEGKCYEKSYVKEVTELIEYSSLSGFQIELNDGSHRYSVFFAAKCVLYSKGYIIPDYKVKKVTSSTVTFKNEYSICNIQMNRLTGIPIKIGSTLPLVVLQSPKYIFGTTNIIVLAMPLSMEARNTFIQSIGVVMPESMVKKLDKVANDLNISMEKNIKKLKENHINRYKYFNKIFLNSDDKGRLPPGKWKKIDLFDVKTYPTKDVVLTYSHYNLSNSVYYRSIEKQDEAKYKLASHHVIGNSILKYKNLNNIICHMSVIYENDKYFEENKNLFKHWTKKRGNN